MGSAPGSRLDDEARQVLQRARSVFTEQQVAAAITTVARDIELTYRHRTPVVLAMMHGALFTAVELCRRFRFPYEFDYMHLTRYRGGLTGGRLDWLVPPRAELAGRTVLLVDDVLDRGETLRAAHAALTDIGVAGLATVVLVEKRVTGVRRPKVDFVALTADDVYLFGCGMDYKGYWRGLPAVYAVSDGDAD